MHFLVSALIVVLFAVPSRAQAPTLDLAEIARTVEHVPGQCPMNLTDQYCYMRSAGGGVTMRICKTLFLEDVGGTLFFSEDPDGNVGTIVDGEIHSSRADGLDLMSFGYCENRTLTIYTNVGGIGWFEQAYSVRDNGNTLYYRSISDRGAGAEQLTEQYSRSP